MGKFFNFKRSSFVIWILSYVVILVLSLTVNMFIQAKASDSLKAEMFNTTSALLSQAQNNIDSRMNDISKIAMQINWNPSVRQMLYDSADSYPANKYNDISNSLRSFQASNSFIDKIYIFPEAKDSVVTQGATMRSRLREDLIHKYTTREGGDIGSLLGQKHYGNIVPLTFTPPSGEAQQKIAFIQSLPYDSVKLRATLFVLIDNSILIPSMNIDDWLLGNYVFVLDESGNVLTTNAPFELQPSMLSSPEERFSVQMGDEHYTVMQAASSTYGWKYLFVLPDYVFLKEFNKVIDLFRVSIAVFLVVGLIASIWFARRNYFPLKRLTAVFEKESGILFSKGENEFDFIESAIDAALGRNRGINDEFSKQFIAFRSSFILRLLKNNLDLGISIDEALATYNIEFISSRFAVIIFHINEIDGDSLGQREEQRQRIAKYIIHNVFDEIVNGEHYGFVVEAEDGPQAMLVNIKPDCASDSDIRASLTRCLQTAMDYIEEAFKIVLIVSVSNVKDSLSTIHEAYMEAYTAAEYDVLMGNSGLEFYGNIELDIKGDSEPRYYYYYPLQLEAQFSNFIKAGNYDDAKAILDDLFTVNFEKHPLPQPIVRCFMFNLTSTIMKTIYEINIVNRNDHFENINAVEMLLNCQSVTEINMKLNQILIDLCQHMHNINSSKNFGADIEEFVESNYSDPSLDITMISERFSITSSYLSKKFKNSTNFGLLDFINKTRITHAKELLRNKGDSIAEIAVACGFVNSNTFIRVFKKYEGITPGRFREISAGSV